MEMYSMSLDTYLGTGTFDAFDYCAHGEN